MTPLSFSALFLVGIGGAVGAIGRYSVGVLLGQWLGSHWPYGTFSVNIVGGLLMGIVAGLGTWSNLITPELRIFLAVGVLGGFTTFSAFSLDLMLMLERHQWLMALGYGVASVLLALAALAFGIFLVRTIVG